MTDLISRSEMRHQLSILLAAKPFDCDPYNDGRYSGLRSAARLLAAMPEAKAKCEGSET